jgi:hypothetical protein
MIEKVALKMGIEGIQGEFQTWILFPTETDQQAPFSSTFLFFNKPFQIQEDWGLTGASKKEISLGRYLPLRASTHNIDSLESNFHPILARRELLMNSIEQMSRPPKALGWHMLSHDKKERLCFLSWGKPHQNFLRIELISKQKCACVS